MRRNAKITLILPEASTLSERCFLALLALVWAYPTMGGFVVAIMGRLPLVNYFSRTIIPACVVVLVMFSLRYIIQRLRPMDVLFYMVFVCLLLLTILMLPENAEHIEKQIWTILLTVAPMYYIGLAMDLEKCKKLVYWASLLGLLVTFVYQLYVLASGRTLQEDNMSTSYKALPCTMYLIWWAFCRKKLIHWLPVVLGVTLCLLCGTRGPVVALVIYLVVEWGLTSIRKGLSWKGVVFLLVLVAAFAFIASGSWQELVLRMSQWAEDLGFSTRVFELLLSGDFSTSNGRTRIANSVIEGIWEKPFLGHGIMGDRVVTGGRYSHNLVLEILCQNGLVLGTVLLLALVCFLAVALVRNRRTEKGRFLLMMTCLVITKLMLSGSYLTETHFFLLLGLGVSQLRLPPTCEEASA